MATTFLPPDEPGARKKGDVDWQGILYLALGLGAFQTFLEQGQQDDWFSSVFIQRMAFLSVIGMVLFVWQELRIAHPAVDLRVLRYRSLAAGSTISLVVGMGLYGTVFVVRSLPKPCSTSPRRKTGLMLVPGAAASAVAMFRARAVDENPLAAKPDRHGLPHHHHGHVRARPSQPRHRQRPALLAAHRARLRRRRDVPAALHRHAGLAAEIRHVPPARASSASPANSAAASASRGSRRSWPSSSSSTARNSSTTPPTSTPLTRNASTPTPLISDLLRRSHRRAQPSPRPARPLDQHAGRALELSRCLLLRRPRFPPSPCRSSSLLNKGGKPPPPDTEI